MFRTGTKYSCPRDEHLPNFLSSGGTNILQNSNIIVGQPCAHPLDVPSGVKDPLYFKFPARLSALRCACDLSVEDVARACGISRGSLSKLEDALQIPKVDHVEEIAAVFNVAPSWLAYGPDGTLVFADRRPRSSLPPDFPEPDFAKREPSNEWRGMGERLIAARERAHLSLRAVTASSAVSPQAILLIERGVSVPKISTIEQVARALGVAPGWLAFGDGQGPFSASSSSARVRAMRQ